MEKQSTVLGSGFSATNPTLVGQRPILKRSTEPRSHSNPKAANRASNPSTHKAIPSVPLYQEGLPKGSSQEGILHKCSKRPRAKAEVSQRTELQRVTQPSQQSHTGSLLSCLAGHANKLQTRYHWGGSFFQAADFTDAKTCRWMGGLDRKQQHQGACVPHRS